MFFLHKLPIKTLPKKHKLSISSIAVLLFIFILLPNDQASAERSTKDSAVLEVGKPYSLHIQVQEQPTVEPHSPQVHMAPPSVPAEPLTDSGAEPTISHLTYEIKKGDNLALIFQRLGFTPQQLYRLTQADTNHTLKRIHPGNQLRFDVNTDNEITAFRLQLNKIETYNFLLTEGTIYQVQKELAEFEIRIASTQATISNSFWNAGIEAGLTQNQIMNLADLFGWDIDFALDIRKGDHFVVLYEEKYIDGEYIERGRIIAAEFKNQKDTFQAIRHENGSFYTPEGKNLRKSFLRAPVHFTRVSSNFNPKRLHPVTKSVRPHNGIDYAAATGTPVMASGDGKVVASGYTEFNGNYVFIQHGERYLTKYLHLHKRQVKKGDKVRQGQVIGQVGATGMATGPHLHYEFLVDGIHRNPRTVTLPQAESLSPHELNHFVPHAQQYIAMIEQQKSLYLAMNHEPN